MKKANHLETWYENARYISSPLQINPVASRKKVDFIYHQLLAFFGKDYFEYVIGQDKPMDKISWLYSLLVNSSHKGCIGGLDQIAQLIAYAAQLSPELQKEMLDKRESPENLRTFFFELYIFHFLDRNGFPNQKKIKEGNQELEGSFVMSGKEFLFECRKVFLPKMTELDVIRRLLTALYKSIQQVKKHIPKGMICTIRLSKPVIGDHLGSFEHKIRTFIKGLNEAPFGISKIDYTVKDSFGDFEIVDYDEATIIELRSRKAYDLLLYLVPPTIAFAGQPIKHVVKIEGNFSLNRSAVYQKLEAALKEKKKQHKHSLYEHKVIFIDIEVFPEFRMGLFPKEDMLDENEVNRVYKKMRLNHILCIIRRIYQTEFPQTEVKVFAPEALLPEANQLKFLLEHSHTF